MSAPSSESTGRAVDFRTSTDLFTDLDGLASAGYRSSGRWDLAQTCRHLSFFVRGSLEGFEGLKVPAPIRWIARAFILPRVRKDRGMRKGTPTLPQSVYPPGGDAGEAIEELRSLFKRLEEGNGELHPSPIFGRLSRDEWRELHLIHAAHHLRFLVPANETQDR